MDELGRLRELEAHLRTEVGALAEAAKVAGLATTLQAAVRQFDQRARAREGAAKAAALADQASEFRGKLEVRSLLVIGMGAWDAI